MKKITLLFLFLFLMALPMLAQDAEGINIDQAIVVAILASLGIGVIGIVKMISDLLGLAKLGKKILTFIVSFGATAAYLVQAEMFTILAFIIYGAIVFGEASGLYRIIKKS